MANVSKIDPKTRIQGATYLGINYNQNDSCYSTSSLGSATNDHHRNPNIRTEIRVPTNIPPNVHPPPTPIEPLKRIFVIHIWISVLTIPDTKKYTIVLC